MNNSFSRRQDFAPSCPSGGTWWACGYGTFFAGCCARDPCNITCVQGNLYPGAFDPAAYGTFPDATCGTGSKFYSCTGPPVFWGCCKSNACSQGGCPDGDLEPAILNRDDQLSAYHGTGGSTTLSSATQTASSISASATSTAPVTAEKEGTSVAAIAGGTAVGVLALAAIAGGLVYYCCFAKKKKKKNAEKKAAEEQTNKESQMQLQQQRDAPPDYTTPTQTYPPYTPPTSTYYAYNHTPHFHSPHPALQELPTGNFTPSTPHTRKSHAHAPSELSADNTLSELGSPDMDSSPKGKQGDFKHMPTPFTLSPLTEYEESGTRGAKGGERKSRFIEMSPLSAADRFENTVSASERRGWVAPQNWDPPAPPNASDRAGYGGAQGLGVGGLDGVDDIMARMERLVRLDDQRAPSGAPRSRPRGVGRPI